MHVKILHVVPSKINIYAILCTQHNMHRSKQTVDYCEEENSIVAFVEFRILAIG